MAKKKELPEHDVESTKPGQGSVIKRCTCTHEFQDSRYGKQMRLFNVAGRERVAYVCTVCGNKIIK